MVVNAYGFTVIDLQPLRAERAAERAAAGAAGRAPRR
jgi:hypothetical protein